MLKNKIRPIDHKSISKITLTIMSDEELRAIAATEVRNKAVSKIPNGLLDGMMGAYNQKTTCPYCRNDFPNCPGHLGYTKLHYPVILPTMVQTVIQFAKVVCLECGAFMLEKQRVHGVPKEAMLSAYVDLTKNKTKKNKVSGTDMRVNIPCPKCGALHPHIKLNKEYTKKQIKCVINTVMYDSNGRPTETVLWNHILLAAFERVDYETVAIVGKPPESHPKNLIRYMIPCPPLTIRPDKKIGSADKISHDDLTLLYKTVIEQHLNLPVIIPDIISGELGEKYIELSHAVYDLHLSAIETNTNKRVQSTVSGRVGIAKRFPGKRGLFRESIMASRTFNMARSVVSGDPRIKLHEIGVPVFMARELHKDMVVTKDNYQEAMIYLKNGINTYPGSKSVRKKDGSLYEYENAKMDINLEYGDIIQRDLIDGDIIALNRQPTLWELSIRSHEVKVIFGSDTIRINPSMCFVYNADFDGDEMNLISGTSQLVSIEMKYYCGSKYTSLQPKHGSPTAGLFQNGLFGMSRLTRSSVIMNPENAMYMLSGVPDTIHIDPKKKQFSGRDVVSLVLPRTVNISKKSAFYNPDFPIEYDPNDINVVIKNGHIVSGILDYKTLGQNSIGSIFHSITHSLGAPTSNRTIYNMQQISDIALELMGGTIHIGDMILPEHAFKEVQTIVESNLRQYHEYEENFRLGKLSFEGTDWREQREIDLAKILNNTKQIEQIIARNIDIINGNTGNMLYGSKKGSMENAKTLLAVAGQQTIEGRRLTTEKIRSSMYAQTSSDDPRDYGYIINPLIEGMNVVESLSMAKVTRSALTHRMLSTAITGKHNRDSGKNVEGIYIDEFRVARRGNGSMLQPLYALCGIDMCKIIRIDISFAFATNAEYEAKYKNDKLPEEYVQLLNDKKNICEWVMRIDGQRTIMSINTSEIIIPFDIDNIIACVINDATTVGEVDAGKESYEMVERFLRRLPYVFTNRFDNGIIPITNEHACYAPQIIIRNRLCTKQLMLRKITPIMLDIILKNIFSTYKLALIEPGKGVGLSSSLSINEEYTQFMLDAHARVGIGGTKAEDKLRGIELMITRDTDKMKNPKMYIALIESLRYNKDAALKLSHQIKMTRFAEMVKNGNGAIFGGEIIGQHKHPILVDQDKYIADMVKYQGTKIPHKLSSIVIRFVLSRDAMVANHFPMEELISVLNEKYSDIMFIVHSSDTIEEPSISCYILETAYKSNYFTMAKVMALEALMIDTIVRGIDNIVKTELIEHDEHYVAEDGSLAKRVAYAIKTYGSNMSEILMIEEFDGKRCYTDSVHEMVKYFGLGVGYNSFIREVRKSFETPAFGHAMLFASELFHTGELTGVSKAGINSRDSDFLTKASYISPVDVLARAAINGQTANIQSPSACIIAGSEIKKIGSSISEIIVDESILAETAIDMEEMI